MRHTPNLHKIQNDFIWNRNSSGRWIHHVDAFCFTCMNFWNLIELNSLAFFLLFLWLHILHYHISRKTTGHRRLEKKMSNEMREKNKKVHTNRVKFTIHFLSLVFSFLCCVRFSVHSPHICGWKDTILGSVNKRFFLLLRLVSLFLLIFI